MKLQIATYNTDKNFKGLAFSLGQMCRDKEIDILVVTESGLWEEEEKQITKIMGQWNYETYMTSRKKVRGQTDTNRSEGVAILIEKGLATYVMEHETGEEARWMSILLGTEDGLIIEIEGLYQWSNSKKESERTRLVKFKELTEKVLSKVEKNARQGFMSILLGDCNAVQNPNIDRTGDENARDKIWTQHLNTINLVDAHIFKHGNQIEYMGQEKRNL